jgi:hypothetical protein
MGNQKNEAPPGFEHGGRRGKYRLEGIHILQAEHENDRVERLCVQLADDAELASVANQKPPGLTVTFARDLHQSGTGVDAHVVASGCSDGRSQHPLPRSNVKDTLSRSRSQQP